MKTHKRDNRNLFKSIKTAYNKRAASEIEVADWQLKVMVPGTEPIWIAFDRREQRMQTDVLKTSPPSSALNMMLPASAAERVTSDA